MRNKWVLIYGVLLVVFFGGMIGYTNYALARAPRVYFKIRPRDPRALLLGDYMALSYEVEDKITAPYLFYVGPDGIVTTEPGEQTVAISIPVARKRTARWRPGVLRVPHQFYFEEGSAARYANAVYAQMRHLPDGRFLLENLTDENLQPL